MAEDLFAAETLDLIDFLTASQNRIRILGVLSEVGCCQRREFQERLDISRTAVKRNLDALVEQGWVTETAKGYKLTACGQQLQIVFADFVSSVETIQRLQPFLRWVSLDEFDVDIRHLTDADLTVGTPNNPYAPANRHVEALRTATEFKICTDVVGRDAFEQIRDRIVGHDSHGELVLTDGALETVRSDPSYTTLYDEIADTDRLAIYVYDGTLPYSLGVIDGLVQIGAEDEFNVPKALLETESKPVREWARAEYAAFRDQAERLV